MIRVEVGWYIDRKMCDDLIRSFGMSERDFDIEQERRGDHAVWVVYHLQNHPMLGPIRGWFDTFDNGWRAATVAVLGAHETKSRRERRWRWKAFLLLQERHGNYDWPWR